VASGFTLGTLLTFFFLFFFWKLFFVGRCKSRDCAIAELRIIMRNSTPKSAILRIQKINCGVILSLDVKENDNLRNILTFFLLQF